MSLQRRALGCAALLIALSCTTAARAALIGVAPDFPRIAYGSQGTLTYDSVTQQFAVRSIPAAIRFTSGDPPRLVTPSGATPAQAVILQIQVGGSGALIGGVAGDDLLVTGAVDADGNGSIDYTGVLLTGEVIAFGFEDSGGPTDFFDFLLTPTGGALAPFYEGALIGMTLIAESSTFDGMFVLNFSSAKTKGDIGPWEPECGDGIRTPDEECDDGNNVNGDGCSATCRLEECGNGIVDPGEDCDDGVENSDTIPNACRTDCTRADCGDGVVDDGEACDDGNNVETDGCHNDCTLPECGDGIVDPGEACDEGNANSDTDPNACRTDCTLPACGDGVRDNGEACDDGNDINTDECRNDCTLPYCGDGIVDPGEACDDGVNNSNTTPDACRTDCTLPECGDGVVDDGEVCDDGNENDFDACRNNCTVPRCGDGILDTNEECDNGANNSDTTPNACRTDCTLPECGDGVVDNGETCDDGNLVDDDGCRNDCTQPVCGDGILDSGEACDNGVNNSDTTPNACRTDCTLPDCGDGVVDNGETCDDGNSNDDDGCRNDCTQPVCGDGILDAGEACDNGLLNSDTVPNACRTDCMLPECGDGVVDNGETCDDGNRINTDDCRNDCTPPRCGDGVVDSGEACDEGANNSDTTPNACRTDCTLPECGDGVVDNGETCDDGNQVDDDACRNDCTQPVCGDGILDAGEECDNGANNSDTTPNACRTDCMLPECGDGVVDQGEACDDGNSNDDDGCRNDCSQPVCGDGILDSGEECDNGVNNSDIAPNACRTDCMLPECGDGVVDAGESCDDGNDIDTDSCRNNCTIPRCGDGIFDSGEECDEGILNSDTVPNACRTDCMSPGCGDGVVDAGELCDDGNNVDTDDCRNNCSLSTCGDGVLDPGEACDDGVDNSDTIPNACRTDCTRPMCGDGVVDDSEVCDDGNRVNTDGCRNDCTTPICGDGIVDAGEQCDEGPFNSDTLPDSCRTNCMLPMCGDGVVDFSESCDDGNDIDTDGCRNNCTIPRCGDAVLDSGEECDNGVNNSDTVPNACRTDCMLPECGDGVIDNGEICDDGNDIDNDDCRNNCTRASCGDGVPDPGEACDDGVNNSDTVPNACRTDCTLPECGDGVIDNGETCDDGNRINTDDCRNDCTPPRCGDGILDLGEACDKGANNSDTVPNACRTDCMLPECGDGVKDTGEACDDGNDVNNDTCRNDCTLPECGDGVVDAGEACDDGPNNSDTEPNACRTDCTRPECGDGVKDDGEACDDGNDINTDDCRNDCTAPRCGDGIVDPGEACDDGNATGGDGCENDCTRSKGACCLDSNDCLELTRAECADRGGDYFGDGTGCANVDCREEGACCIEDDKCFVTTEADCLEMGGEFSGPGTECVAAPDMIPDTGRYHLSHSDDNGAEHPPSYGLRLDGLFNDYPTVYTFSFKYPGTDMYLDWDGSTICIHGIAYGGKDVGDHWASSKQSYVEVYVVYGNVQVVGDKLSVPVGAPSAGRITWLATGEVIPLTGKDDGTQILEINPTYGHGWLMYEWGAPGCCLDFKFNRLKGKPSCPETTGACCLPGEWCAQLPEECCVGAGGLYRGDDTECATADCPRDPVCGDGAVDPGEECDDGVNNSDTEPGACRTDCRSSYCGDGVVDPGEECDLGTVAVATGDWHDDEHDPPGDECTPECTLPCGPCDGKMTTLTLRYLGVAPSEVKVVQKKDDIVVFLDSVGPNEEFFFVGTDRGTLSTEVRIYVNGDLHRSIHTSCSEPIEVGMVFGDFEIVAGTSKNGGALCDDREPRCGDGILQVGEACDDGNTNDGDGCSSTCTSESDCVCGPNNKPPHITCPLPGDCACPVRVIDFETDGLSSLGAGFIMDGAFPALGVTIDTENFAAGHPDLAIIFDTSNPTGGDTDLATPGYHPTNTVPLGNVLIIAEDAVDNNGNGRVDDPDDEGARPAGYIDFTFDKTFTAAAVQLLDVEGAEAVGSIQFFENGSSVGTRPINGLGDNSVQTVSFDASTFDRMRVNFGGSGSVASLRLTEDCPCEPGEPTVEDDCDPAPTLSYRDVYDGQVALGAMAPSNPTPQYHWRSSDTSEGTRSPGRATHKGRTHDTAQRGDVLAQRDPMSTQPKDEDDVIRIPHVANMALADGTIALSFRADGALRGAGLFSKDADGRGEGGQLTIGTTSDGRVRVQLESDRATHVVESAPRLEPDTWHRAALAFGSGGMRLFVDGALTGSDAFAGGMLKNHESVVIGASAWAASDDAPNDLTGRFNGSIRDVMVFDRALTDDELNGASQVATGNQNTCSNEFRRVWTATDSCGASAECEQVIVTDECDGQNNPQTASVLFVVASASNLNQQERAKKELMESWGFEVMTISDGSSSSSYNEKLALVEVVYVSETVNSGDVGSKLSNTTVGVVCEEGYLDDALWLAAANASDHTDRKIDIVDNGHFITSVFDTGRVKILSSNQLLPHVPNGHAPGLRVLGEKRNSDSAVLGIAETGATLRDGHTANGRRVMLPWGRDGFDCDGLTDNGRTIMRRALEWAASRD